MKSLRPFTRPRTLASSLSRISAVPALRRSRADSRASSRTKSFTPSLGERPPRLVLRFAILSALCLGAGAAAILGVVRHLNTGEAQRNAAQQAQFVAQSMLTGKLRAADFARPVSRRRRAQLDRFFERNVLQHRILLVTLSRRDRVVTYSTDHRLIGRRSASAARTAEAYSGTLTSEVTSIAHGPKRRPLKVLQSYVPLTPAAGGRGVVAVFQDYSPIAKEARAAFIPIAGILELVLVVLYVLLVPLLGRVARRIRRQIEHIEYQAFHDDLTDLPNRLHFRNRIAAAVAEAKARSENVAVLLVDLDRFKEINDTLGHSSGDELLEQLSARLRRLLEEDVLLARLGGDEFGIVVPGGSAQAALELAGRLRDALEAPFVVNSVPLVVEGSVGVAVYPTDGEEVDALIQRADIAMYAAKSRRLGVVRYDPQLETTSAEQLSLMSELRRALDEDELVLHFQPKVDLASAEIYGAEALVRWEHPTRGLLQPAAFLPFAERTGLSRGLSRFVLSRAVRQLREWADAGTPLDLSVNLTMFDLLDLGLADEVSTLLEREGVEPARLELEITESVIMADAVRVREVVARLRDVGVRVAIDDFGTGFSSLSYLKTLPVDVLKIDRSFVMEMVNDESDRTIVRSTTDLAHSLGVRVVAEGVASEEILHEVRKIGCDAAQGFYIARPTPAEKFGNVLADWLERRPAPHAQQPRPAAIPNGSIGSNGRKPPRRVRKPRAKSRRPA
jgi:diguanylate cyclase (GGDEF)-like protein